MTVASNVMLVHHVARILALSLLLLAFAPFVPANAANASADTCGLDCVAVTSQSSFLACLRAAFPRGGKGRKHILVLPSHKAYDAARMVTNLRISRKPAAVVYAKHTSHVVAAVQCATASAVHVSVAGGRHAYQGTAMQDGYLIVDVSNMTQLHVMHTPVLSARVGAGNTNSLLGARLRTHAPADVFAVIGQCPSVGISGYILGGGMSITSRTHGLACDQLLSLELVLFNGTVIRADATTHADVLWASCGGGGGLGVVTEFVLRLHRMPSQVLSKVSLAFKPERLVDGLMLMQRWWASSEARLAGGGGSGRVFLLSFWGTVAQATDALQQAGLLDPALLDPSALQGLGVSGNLNLSIVEFPSYAIAFLAESCVVWVGGLGGSVAKLFPGRTTADCFNPVFLLGEFAAMASTPGSPISSGTSTVWTSYAMSQCRTLDPPSRSVWEALLGHRTPGDYGPECNAFLSSPAQQQAQEYASGSPLSSRCYARTVVHPNVNHLLGGAVAAVSPTATATFYRTKYSPICFDYLPPASWVGRDGTLRETAMHLDPSVGPLLVHPPLLVNAALEEMRGRWDEVYGLLGRQQAHVGYINYQMPPVSSWQSAYFGDNKERLAAVKAAYDPLSVFSKPYIVEGLA